MIDPDMVGPAILIAWVTTLLATPSIVMGFIKISERYQSDWFFALCFTASIASLILMLALVFLGVLYGTS